MQAAHALGEQCWQDGHCQGLAAAPVPELPQPGQRVLGHVAVDVVALGQVLREERKKERKEKGRCGEGGAGQQSGSRPSHKSITTCAIAFAFRPRPPPTWNSQRPLTSQVMQSAGWLALSRDSTPRMLSFTLSVSVCTWRPSHTGVAQAGLSWPPAPVSTRHNRQVPGVVGRRGWVHSVGICREGRRLAEGLGLKLPQRRPASAAAAAAAADSSGGQ